MGLLQCQQCGRVIDSWMDRKIGLPCGLNGCSGVFEFHGGRNIVYMPSSPSLDLQCRDCFHICSSAITGLSVGDSCPVKGCWGRLDRYFH